MYTRKDLQQENI